MPRQLADVLHHLLPDAPPEPTGRWLAVPLDEHDLVRAALCWNLAVELTRLGPAVHLAAPPMSPLSALCTGDEPGPLGLRVSEVGPGALATLAPPRDRPRSLTVAVHPPDWLEGTPTGGDREIWVVALIRPGTADRERALELLGRARRARPRARLGACVHGARSIGEARDTFEGLARRIEGLGVPELRSYGLLVEDLDLCRSIVTRQPVAIAWPRSAAARALADVARLLAEDLLGDAQ